MAYRGKRYKQAFEKVQPETRLSLGEAIEVVKSMPAAKFDESVDVAMRLGVDPTKSDQMVRGVAKLPHGTGKTVRILVFAAGEKAQEATAAGADFVGADDLVEKIKGGWLEFDKAIATPDMMPKIGTIAKILGPRGLMPNPKVGTVTTDVTKAINDEKAGRVEFRVEKAGNLHASVGKRSFSSQQLAENIQALMDQVLKAKPSSAKGNYLLGVSVSATMSPGVRVDPTKINATDSKEA